MAVFRVKTERKNSHWDIVLYQDKKVSALLAHIDSKQKYDPIVVTELIRFAVSHTLEKVANYLRSTQRKTRENSTEQELKKTITKLFTGPAYSNIEAYRRQLMEQTKQEIDSEHFSALVTELVREGQLQIQQTGPAWDIVLVKGGE